jgi:hypothetical protein
MKVARGVKAAALALVTAGVITLVGVQVVTPRACAQDNADTEQSQIAIGWRIAPSFINVNLRTVAQLLGHRTLQMAMRYAHLSQSHELAAVERLCKTGEGNEKRSDTSPKGGLEKVA